MEIKIKMSFHKYYKFYFVNNKLFFIGTLIKSLGEI